MQNFKRLLLFTAQITVLLQEFGPIQPVFLEISILIFLPKEMAKMGLLAIGIDKR